MKFNVGSLMKNGASILKYKTKFKINSQINKRKINKYKRIDKRKIINKYRYDTRSTRRLY